MKGDSLFVEANVSVGKLAIRLEDRDDLDGALAYPIDDPALPLDELTERAPRELGDGAAEVREVRELRRACEEEL